MEKITTKRTLDIDRILATKIPDIHPVYDGVRGRTMSSKHQAYAWPTIVDSGIHTIIDLREDGITNSRMFELCEQYGMRHFYYPVHKRGTLVDEMIDRFEEFCRLIDEGGFYIACAMGLHRTDIALCTYWVFYGADKGLDAPEIRGYRQEDGHDTGNIMTVLNAFYKRLTERTSKEPMSPQTFQERKQVIKQLSRKTDAGIDISEKKRVYIEMDRTLADFGSGLAKVSEEVKKEYLGRFNEIPGLFSLMDPISGAIEAIQKMQQSGRFEVYIVSSAPCKNMSAWTEKAMWVEKYLGDTFTRRFIMTPDKSFIIGDIIIDYSSGMGTKHFKGEWIQFGKTEFPDWESVLKYLKVK